MVRKRAALCLLHVEHVVCACFARPACGRAAPHHGFDIQPEFLDEPGNHRRAPHAVRRGQRDGLVRHRCMARIPRGLVTGAGEQREAPHVTRRGAVSELRTGDAPQVGLEPIVVVRFVETGEHAAPLAAHGIDAIVVEEPHQHVRGFFQRLCAAQSLSDGNAGAEHRTNREVGDVEAADTWRGGRWAGIGDTHRGAGCVVNVEACHTGSQGTRRSNHRARQAKCMRDQCDEP